MNRPCLLCMRLFRDAHVADAEHVPSEGSQKHASVTERAATRVGTSDSAARSVAGTTEHPRRHLLTDEKKMVSSSRPATDFARRPRALGASRVASRAVIRHGRFEVTGSRDPRKLRNPRWDAAPRLEYLREAVPVCQLSTAS